MAAPAARQLALRATARQLLLAIAASAVCILSYAATPFEDAFNDAKTYGAGRATDAKGKVNAGQGNSNVPYYGGTVTNQTSVFQAGQGSATVPATNRAIDCAVNPQSGTPYTLQECEAINFMRQSPGARPRFVINRAQPVIANTSNAAKNPAATLGGPTATSLNGTYSACTNETIPAANVVTTEICYDFKPVTANVCSVGWQITVDPHHLYQCAEQLQNLATSTCQVKQIVEVDAKYTYECSTPNSILATNSCTKTLSVSVNQYPSCNFLDQLGEGVIPWTTYRFGGGLFGGRDWGYANGAVIRPVCKHTDTEIDIRYWAGTVFPPMFGSRDAVPPLASNVPASNTVTVNKNSQGFKIAGVADAAQNSFFTVNYGSCDTSTCTYNFSVGRVKASCPSGHVVYNAAWRTYDFQLGGYVWNPTPAQDVDPVPDQGGICLQSVPATVIYDFEGYVSSVTCPPGTIDTVGFNCFVPPNPLLPAAVTYGPSTAISGGGWLNLGALIGGGSSTVVFPRPRIITEITDNWDNRCALFEERAK